MDAATIKERLGSYEWWQSVPVAHGITTPGSDAVRQVNDKVLEVLRGVPLAGKRVLEIGCRDGLFSFEAERLGAAEVIGIDHILSKGALELLIPAKQSKVRMVELNMFDLKPETFGKFDVVIFCGVLYHLRYPFWALKLLHDVLSDGGTMVLETACFRSEDPDALLWCPIGDESPYEATSVTFYNEKGLHDTLKSIGFRVHGTTHVVSPPELTAKRAAKRAALHVASAVGQLAKAAGVEAGAIDQGAQRVHRKETYRAIVRCGVANELVDPDVSVYWDGKPTAPKNFHQKG